MPATASVFFPAWGLALALVAGGSGPPVAIAGGASCDTSSIGLRVDSANDTYGGAFFGRSAGQVFDAPHTHIQAITVWRQADAAENQVPMHLFLCAMDPLNPQRPDPLNVLLDGPSISLHGTSDSPRPVRFTFEPPWSLPAPGRYFFAVKEDLCFAAFVLLADSTDGYKDGELWQITPSAGCEGLGNGTNVQSGKDLIFDIEFCEPIVDARVQSWGRLKAAYR